MKVKSERSEMPVGEATRRDVVSFHEPFEARSPLDQIVREGARRMLQEAIDAEVELFVSSQQHRRDEAGRRLVVKNGSRPHEKF